ncbi:hypothetical protein IWQ60_000915 [Tieghemiomyces parasiticus]|uniref:Uncharacterized protein n=1 Tax=Tieghemiomyces parasiticus TaxID=78921 RepID=A0A9W8AF82_9FUNG|nr:hypothetical protein IWQ60_000915 [Tieghemiomyces parasiticus]
MRRPGLHGMPTTNADEAVSPSDVRLVPSIFQDASLYSDFGMAVVMQYIEEALADTSHPVRCGGGWMAHVPFYNSDSACRGELGAKLSQVQQKWTKAQYASELVQRQSRLSGLISLVNEQPLELLVDFFRYAFPATYAPKLASNALPIIKEVFAAMDPDLLNLLQAVGPVAPSARERDLSDRIRLSLFSFVLSALVVQVRPELLGPVPEAVASQRPVVLDAPEWQKAQYRLNRDDRLKRLSIFVIKVFSHSPSAERLPEESAQVLEAVLRRSGVGTESLSMPLRNRLGFKTLFGSPPGETAKKESPSRYLEVCPVYFKSPGDFQVTVRKSAKPWSVLDD